jgi:hypothetical protein
VAALGRTWAPDSSGDTIATVAACLIVIFAINLAGTLVDIFGIPIPTHLWGVPLLGWLPFYLLIGLYPLVRVRGGSGIGITDLLVLGTLVIWILLELLHAFGGARLDLGIVTATFWPVLAYITTRAYLTVFEDSSTLINAFIRIIALVGLGHLMLLGAVQGGLDLPLIQPAEVSQRNGISLLLVFALFLTLFVDPRRRLKLTRRAVLLLVLAAGHAWLNSARAAAGCLVILVLAWPLIAGLGSRRVLTFLFVLAAATVLFAVTFSGNLLSIATEGVAGYSQVASLNDDVLSAIYRASTNGLIVEQFLESPLFGIGFAGVSELRVGGYITHTLYLLYLGAYGVLGLIPLVVSFAVLIYVMKAVPGSVRALTVLFVVAVTSFVNDPLPWLGALFGLLTGPPMVQMLSEEHQLTQGA